MRQACALAICLLVQPGCSSDAPPDGAGSTGGSAGASGATLGSGGSIAGGRTGPGGASAGGATTSGGTGGVPAGGTSANGGAVGRGGNSGTGGAATTGGSANSGGTSSSTGGTADAGGNATLKAIPWEGGPAYWNTFPRAKAAGWTDPAFFPLGIWFEAVDNLPRLKAVGINLYVGTNHSSSDISIFKQLNGNDGVFFIMNDEWSTSDLGSNARLSVGALVSDEIDMISQNPVSDQQRNVNAARARNDGRFVYANYGKGAIGTFWNAESMPQLVRMVDVASDDLYFFTDPNLPGEVPQSDAWPDGATVRQAASYGWTMARMRGFLGTALHPTWNFVEYSYPWSEPEPADGSKSMNPDKIAGAIWSSIIHEARGIILFNHAFQGARCQGQHTLLDCHPEMRARVTQVFANIKSLAPVLNSQSYEWQGPAKVDGMLKATPDAYYLFVQLGHGGTAGTKSLTLPGNTTGDVEVLFENRTLNAVAGAFSDGFADTNTVHVYKVAR